MKSGFLTILLALITIGLFAPFASAERMNPCAANPCAANPCAGNPRAAPKKPIRSEHVTDHKKLVAMGKDLWNDEELGASGFSCMTCHADHDNLNLDKVKGWPHFVKMTEDIVTLDQMVNYCMINPMAAKPLDPNSVAMTAMAAYYMHYAASFKKR